MYGRARCIYMYMICVHRYIYMLSYRYRWCDAHTLLHLYKLLKILLHNYRMQALLSLLTDMPSQRRDDDTEIVTSK